jgi:hypothetical protein
MGRIDEAVTITLIENHGAAILTDAYWRQRLNSIRTFRRDIRERAKKDRRRPAPDHLLGSADLSAVDVQVAATDSRSAIRRRRHQPIARLKPGVTVAEAQSPSTRTTLASRKTTRATLMMRLPVAGASTHADHVRRPPGLC